MPEARSLLDQGRSAHLRVLGFPRRAVPHSTALRAVESALQSQMSDELRLFILVYGLGIALAALLYALIA